MVPPPIRLVYSEKLEQSHICRAIKVSNFGVAAVNYQCPLTNILISARDKMKPKFIAPPILCQKSFAALVPPDVLLPLSILRSSGQWCRRRRRCCWCCGCSYRCRIEGADLVVLLNFFEGAFDLATLLREPAADESVGTKRFVVHSLILKRKFYIPVKGAFLITVWPEKSCQICIKVA